MTQTNSFDRSTRRPALHGLCRRRMAAVALASVSAVSAALCAAPARASTHVVSTYLLGDHSWSDAANWSNAPAVGSYPNNTALFDYDAIVNGGTLTLSEPITIQNLTVNGSMVYIKGAGDFTTNQKLSLNNQATFGGTGALNALGGFDVSGIGAILLDGRATTVAAGTVSNWNCALSLLHNATVQLNGTTNLNVGGNFDGTTGSSYTNNGTINQNASYRSQFSTVQFTNAGTINVSAGSFQIVNGGLHTGAFNVAANTQLDVDGDFSSTSKIISDGTVFFLFDAADASHSHTFDGTLNISAAGSFVRAGFDQTFTANSHIVSVGKSMTFNPGGKTYFNNTGAINTGTIDAAGGYVSFQTPAVTATTVNIPLAGLVNVDNPATLHATTVNITGGILGDGDPHSTGTVNTQDLNFSSGGIAQRIEVSGTMNWTGGGIFATNGHVVIEPGAALNYSGGGSITQSGTLEIVGAAARTPAGGDAPVGSAGQLNWTGGNLSVGSFGTLKNGGILTTTIDGTISNTSGVAGTLANSGVFRKSTATGTTHIASTVNVLNDNGAFDVQSGTVAVDGTLTSSSNSTLRLTGAGALQLNGTASTTTLLVAPDIDSTGNLSITAGTTTVGGYLGVGNDGTLTSGRGNGHVTVSGGTLNADTIVLGSTTGGSGDMTISGSGHVVVGGGLSLNDLNVNSGTLTVLDQAPPAGEDPVLNRAIVGGYRRDGAMFVNGGVVTSPKIKLGITAGKTGAYVQTGGTTTVGYFGAGNDGTLTAGAGNGTVSISGGTLRAGTIILGSTTGGSGDMTIAGNGNVVVGGGLAFNDLNVNGGTLTVLDQAPPAGEDPVLDRSIVGGYLRDGAMHVTGGVVTTPRIKLGVSNGNVGTYTQAGGMVSVGTVSLGSAAGGRGDLTLAAGTLAISAQIDIASAGTLHLSGGTLASVPRINLSGAGKLLLAASSSAGGSPLLRASTLNIDAAGSGFVDLNDDDAILSATPAGTVRNYLKRGYDFGNFDGAGAIQSSAARNNPNGNTTLGMLTASEYANNNGDPKFDGVVVQSNDVLIKYTYFGDVDFNGAIDSTDYNLIDFGFLTGASGWANGDVDYSGAIDGTDYNLIDFAFVTQNGFLRRAISYLDGTDRSTHGMTSDPSLAEVVKHFDEFGNAYAQGFLANVPEPTAAMAAIVLTMSLQRRRKRHRAL